MSEIDKSLSNFELEILKFLNWQSKGLQIMLVRARWLQQRTIFDVYLRSYQGIQLRRGSKEERRETDRGEINGCKEICGWCDVVSNGLYTL